LIQQSFTPSTNSFASWIIHNFFFNLSKGSLVVQVYDSGKCSELLQSLV